MKTLCNLKWWAVVALLVLGMSACLKNDDSVNVYVQYPYILQNNDGTFTPQIRLYGNDLQSASIHVAGKNFAFTSLNGYVWELTDSFYAPLGGLDSIPTGYYALTATSMDGKTGNLTVGFAEASKKIGEVDLTRLEYSADDKAIHVELADSVVNASVYYLMIKVPSGSSTTTTFSMWIPYTSLTLSGDRKLSANVSVSNLEAGKYRFAVGANYGSTFRISNQYVSVETGENSVLDL